MVADLVQRGLSSWWAPALAFAAGVVSFASPCVLPLVPGYLSFVTGERASEAKRRPLVPILLFILGFSAVFTLIGAFTASSVSRWLKSATGQRVAGGVVLAFGVFLLLLFYSAGLGIPFLLVGLGLGRLMGALRFFSRNYRWFAGVSGVALVAIGVLLVTGAWTRLVAPLFRVINRFTPAI